MKKIYLIFLIFLISFSSCKRNTAPENILEIKDDLGKSFLFDSIPKRIISLAPSITESIYFLGADSLLTGVTKYCDYPPEAKQKIIIGGMLDPNIELIIKINPDLIFLTTEGNSELTYKALTQQGFKVFVLNPKNVNDVIKTLETLNQIFKIKTAGEKIAYFKKEIRSLKNNEKNKFAGFLSIKPFITFNKSTYLNDLFLQSGFVNIFGDENNSYPAINEEELILKNPEYIFILGDTTIVKKAVIEEFNTRFQELNAVKQNRIFVLDENSFSRPGPRILDALKNLNLIKK